ncbi:MAG TPA: flagellar biosynthesis protein FlhB [Firmicutes bacterium]|nr:flagellar biosynthesis protein FlhB [Bacillota bacterium]
MDEEKTEQPTPRSRQRARERGQMARSRELTGTLVLLVGVLTIYAIMNWWGILASELFQGIIGNLYNPSVNWQTMPAITEYAGRMMFSFLWPIFAATSVAAILFNLLQTKGNISLEPIRPNLNKISPMRGLRRMFSTRGFVELLKAIMKIGMVIIVTWLYIRANMPAIVGSNQLDPTAYLPFFGNHALKLALWIIALFVLISILDYIYQFYQFEKDLMLTKTEAKEEYKQMEGDPLVKSRMRTRQRQIALTAMLREIPRADVVVTNPTHIAVALRYEEDMPAPQLVAKGKGVIAERIISIAKDFDIHIHQDPPLARSLYAMVEVGGFIPYELYVAMAEILAHVYRTKKKFRKRREKMAGVGAG